MTIEILGAPQTITTRYKIQTINLQNLKARILGGHLGSRTLVWASNEATSWHLFDAAQAALKRFKPDYIYRSGAYGMAERRTLHFTTRDIDLSLPSHERKILFVFGHGDRISQVLQDIHVDQVLLYRPYDHPSAEPPMSVLRKAVGLPTDEDLVAEKVHQSRALLESMGLLQSTSLDNAVALHRLAGEASDIKCVTLKTRGSEPAQDAKLIPQLKDDCGKRSLLIHYKDHKGDITTREVSPLIVLSDTYLLSWCWERNGIRRFIVSSIRNVDPMEWKSPPFVELVQALLRYGRPR